MDNKLLIVSVGLVIIALVSVPVSAGKTPIDEIISIVQDIQTKVGTILTKVTSIEQKVQTPPQPIRYEYYTDTLYPPVFGNPMNYYMWTDEQVTNWGDSDAFVCMYRYSRLRSDTTYFPWILLTVDPSVCFHISAGETKSDKSFGVNNDYEYRMKITADSKYVTPRARYYFLDSGTLYSTPYTYLPGDFHKVEIYS